MACLSRQRGPRPSTVCLPTVQSTMALSYFTVAVQDLKLRQRQLRLHLRSPGSAHAWAWSSGELPFLLIGGRSGPPLCRPSPSENAARWTNDRFDEAAPQRPAKKRTAATGRVCREERAQFAVLQGQLPALSCLPTRAQHRSKWAPSLSCGFPHCPVQPDDRGGSMM